ncbi:MAG TPA: PP2C family protein-serine/threonine phosphatase [Thermoanaerobaculia bacterium]
MIQEQLALPRFKSTPRRVSRAHGDVFAFSQAARTFTGDFYFTHREHDLLWFTLGDVSGKGLPAAIVMAMIQEELEHRITSCAATQCDPSTTMMRLHTFLRPLMENRRFATVVIGHLRDDGLLTIANAGHPAPLIARRDGSIEPIDSTGPVAGLLPSSRWCSTQRRLSRGESLLMFSDGLLEAHIGDDEFGSERIAAALALSARDARDARSIVNGVLASAREHDVAFEDDVTLLAIRM